VSAAPSPRLLARVGCEVLVVLGALDPVRVEPLPHVRVEVIAGAGHDPHLETPEAFVTALRARAADRRS
jgi:pimeloyl-ACP methyl ester carboxylesterase